MALKVLNEKGQSNTTTAKTLGVREGAVRYHLRRAKQGARDGVAMPSMARRTLRGQVRMFSFRTGDGGLLGMSWDPF